MKRGYVLFRPDKSEFLAFCKTSEDGLLTAWHKHPSKAVLFRSPVEAVPTGIYMTESCETDIELHKLQEEETGYATEFMGAWKFGRSIFQ